MARLSLLTRRIVASLMPPRCLACGDTLAPGEQSLCLLCISSLPRAHYPLEDELNPVVNRFAGIFPFEHATAWLIYNHDSMIGHLVQCFKYSDCPDLARVLGQRMAEELRPTGIFSGVDCIAPVAQHGRRRLKRGYNQTEYLAMGIADITDLEIIDNLQAARHHHTQTHKTLEQRRENIKGKFRVKNPDELTGRHILLVDDICTTGSTLTAAADALYAANPDIRLTILALAATV